MRSLSESIFLKAPIFLQNIALSLYGIKINHRRYSGEYNKYFDTIRVRRKLSKTELENYINVSLSKIIKEAAENVPYYKELFKKEKITPDDIKCVEDLKKIPLLEKSPIRKGPLRFVNQKYDKKKLLFINTTGTTGTPLTICCNNQTRQQNYAFYDNFLADNGINFKGRRATFGGRIIVPPEQKSPPFWRYSYFQKNMLLSSYHLTDKNIPYYIDELAKFQPDYIDAYPSSLFSIARYAQNHSIDLKNITLGITTSAETLLPGQREVIESVFGIPITDQYGAAEMCVFVGQCKEGNYHIHSDYAILEFLREDGTAAEPGEEAEILCTGLINPVMPLIRYRIGDRGIVSDRKCKCGYPFPVMDKILGRMDDVIITPDGRKVSRFGAVLYGVPVKEAQYMQKVVDSVIVRIVRDEGFTSEIENIIHQRLKKRLGNKIKIHFEYINNIPRGAGGKLKTIISTLS